MLIGNGLLAKAFNDYKNNNEVVIFASGVSNSKELDQSAYKREKILLEEMLSIYKKKIFVYFSTTSIYDDELKKTQYCLHKFNMEQIIKKQSQNYYIFRLSEVVGKSTNKYQIVNYFYNAIQNQQSFTIWKNACRRLIDIDDVYSICHYFIQNRKYENNIYNITTPHKINVMNIVNILEQILDMKSHAKVENKGNCYEIPSELVFNILEEKNELKHILSKDYLNRLLSKYFIEKGI